MLPMVRSYVRGVWGRRRAQVLWILLVCLLAQLFVLLLFKPGIISSFEHSFQMKYSGDIDKTERVALAKRPLKILLLGYMRSGSTFCSDILQANSDIFYVYEPLFYIWDHLTPGQAGYTNHSKRKVKSSFSKAKPIIPEPLDFLNYMYRCNLTAYNVDFLTNIHHSHGFNSKKCRTIIENNTIDRDYVIPCSEVVNERCNSATAVIQKVVRLSMEEADIFLERDHGVKIVHLIRDPRGALLSRMHFSPKLTGEMHKNYSLMCKRVLDDIKTSKAIAGKHFGRIITVRYEDLAQEPLSLFQKLYLFLGLEFTPHVKRYIQERTSLDRVKKDGSILKKSTFRRDPFSTAYQWRKDLPFDIIQKMDQDDACRAVYHLMGYRTFRTSEEMTNMSVSAKLPTFGYGRLTLTL